MWLNEDVQWVKNSLVDIETLLEKIHEELKRANELEYRTDIKMPKIVLDVRQKETKKR